MSENEVVNRLKKCMAAVLEISEEEIHDESSVDNLETWDSLRHINLIIALEQEFGISFPDEEVVFLTSVKFIEMAIYDAMQGENQL